MHDISEWYQPEGSKKEGIQATSRFSRSLIDKLASPFQRVHPSFCSPRLMGRIPRAPVPISQKEPRAKRLEDVSILVINFHRCEISNTFLWP